MKKRFSGPQIVAKLRQADVRIGQGKAVPEVCKEIEISQQTYYRWRMDYNHYRPYSSLNYTASPGSIRGQVCSTLHLACSPKTVPIKVRV